MTKGEYLELVKTDAFRNNAWEDLIDSMTDIVSNVIRFPNSATLKNFLDVGYLASSIPNLQEVLDAFCHFDISANVIRYTCRELGLHCSIFSQSNCVYVLSNTSSEVISEWKRDINKYQNIRRNYHDTRNV